jgi:GrpB-like predicted nucleotidyltransferase (UPF0157 family)
MSEDQIYIVDYDPNWVKSFELECPIVLKALGSDLVVKIEHVGSTAVPGLSAKPIIDMIVFVHSVEKAREKISSLKKLGYVFWEDNPDTTRLFLVKGLPPNGPRTHHIHIAQSGATADDKVIFRDYLRNHPEEAALYLKLKRELVIAYAADREKYTECKGDYVSSVLAKAKQGADK